MRWLTSWCRRVLGISEVEARLAALEGRRPEGRWYTEDDPGRKRQAAVDGLAQKTTGLAPGPAGDPRVAYQRNGYDVPPPTNLGGYL